jgi:hypothetical protein
MERRTPERNCPARADMTSAQDGRDAGPLLDTVGVEANMK